MKETVNSSIAFFLVGLYTTIGIRLVAYVATAASVVLWLQDAPLAPLAAAGWLLLCGCLWLVALMGSVINTLEREVQMVHALGRVAGILEAEAQRKSEAQTDDDRAQD